MNRQQEAWDNEAVDTDARPKAILILAPGASFYTCLLPLCLRALAAPFGSTSFVLTSVFAATVCLYHVLAIVNQRIAYGPPREIDWEHEVVVITGGLGGLGGCIAEIYGLRNVTVAVIDIGMHQELDGAEKENVHYYRCDIADTMQLETVWKRIVQDLGTPTILINNAAVVHSSSLLQAKPADIEQVFRVNTLSQFILGQLFLQALVARRQGGALVTVSSVLGHLGAANLAAYTASKAALLAYHSSLSAELAPTAPQIKTILVAPGQLDTLLFASVRIQGWLQNFVSPVVGAGELAVRIVGMIDQGQGGEIRIPEYTRWVVLFACLPGAVQKVLRWWSGVDTTPNGPRKVVTVADGKDERREETSGIDSSTEEDEESDCNADEDININ
ncbi:MAG: hypothetical protein Q9217_005575 [Psora testacea]